MRRRRKKAEEHTNHERWLVSYADFITLLFAFFVVMYAVSSVNEGKYRVLSNTLTEAFQEPTRSMNPIQIGELQRLSGTLLGDTPSQAPVETESRAGPEVLAPESEDDPESGFEPAVGAGNEAARRQEQKRLGFIAGTIESVLQSYIDNDEVSVSHSGDLIEVDMKSNLLFPSGSAHLSRPAVRILRDLSRILKPLPNPIQVEGNTDNVPIRTEAFPSNWELSAARAASVVHLFARLGIDPRRLSAVGYGEHRPIADNASEQGRRNNRRVTLVIQAGTDPERRALSRAVGGGAR